MDRSEGRGVGGFGRLGGRQMANAAACEARPSLMPPPPSSAGGRRGGAASTGGGPPASSQRIHATQASKAASHTHLDRSNPHTDVDRRLGPFPIPGIDFGRVVVMRRWHVVVGTTRGWLKGRRSKSPNHRHDDTHTPIHTHNHVQIPNLQAGQALNSVLRRLAWCSGPFESNRPCFVPDQSVDQQAAQPRQQERQKAWRPPRRRRPYGCPFWPRQQVCEQ